MAQAPWHGDLAVQMRKYAELAVRVGVNLQPGEHLIIGYGIRPVLPDQVPFARMLTEAAYDAGAKFVQVDWGDEHWLRETVRRGALDTLEARIRWQLEWVERLSEEGAASIGMPATDPKLYDGIDPVRVTQAERTMSAVFRPFTDKRTNYEYSWTLVSAPTQAWADAVFPELPREDRFTALWRAILRAARADGEDPVADWERHIATLQRRADWLNRLSIHKLHYQAPGTDLWVELAPRHIWTAASHKTPRGVRFVPNMPTEEVFTSPRKEGVDGTVTSTMPLNHHGSVIEGIRLRFEGGRIVSYEADSGQEALASIIEADEGSHYLGEVALVPVDSPIAQIGRLFYNTLFDENASCHLAIGSAYPLVEGGHDVPRERWGELGLNTSLMHVDFMIGSPELDIDAVTADGKTVPIFRAGRWATPV
ncbi:aminopeptidase [Alicyclobacillus cellulosilyticus]|uniref:Aminopeptidase n=1 Tax=Alicyclobacillus cellulosilyticus TaxID=1003997 RepID=A0A917K4X6_9BACL|nr:aminopeptidase [Alicyclobacillus cellulosilyticus]GGJ00191.1 aminopeptidase [Alicyclobacillus cellulosilyticus]